MRNLSAMKWCMFFRAVFIFWIVTGLAAVETGKEILSGSQIHALVIQISEELQNKYVYPELAGQMALKLRDNLANQYYPESLSPSEVAARIESDLFEISRDPHLHVVHESSALPGAGVPPVQTNGSSVDDFGFKKIEVLVGNIGYIRIDRMAIEPEAACLASSHLKMLSSARAIIFDLRHNRGGAAGMVNYLSSYFFNTGKLLYSLYNRPQNRKKDIRAFADLEGKFELEHMTVFILTSHETFSAAEAFAYILKHHGRATIVGERTAGGAHPMTWIKLTYGFRLCIPFARIIHPVTQTDWEGKGVIPHYEVDGNKALEKAIDLLQ